MLLILISKPVYIKYVFVLHCKVMGFPESLFKTRSEKCSVQKHDVSCHNLLHSHSHQSMHFHCCRACTNVTKGSNRVPCNLTLFATKMVLHSTGALLLLCPRKESCIFYGYFLVPDSLIHHSFCSSPNTIGMVPCYDLLQSSAMRQECQTLLCACLLCGRWTCCNTSMLGCH